MSWRVVSVAAVLLALLAGCGGEDAAPLEPETGSDASTPTAAVEQLLTHLNTPDFDEAALLAMPGQAALAALAEGATFSDVAKALRDGDLAVSHNFWSGFAQGAGSILTGAVTTTEDGTQTQDGIEYSRVRVSAETGADRILLTRESDGHRIDLFASFGAGLAGRMVPAVERLLTTQTEDARLVLARLQEVVPSLWVALEEEGLDPELHQDLIRLIEVITRLG